MHARKCVCNVMVFYERLKSRVINFWKSTFFAKYRIQVVVTKNRGPASKYNGDDTLGRSSHLVGVNDITSDVY